MTERDKDKETDKPTDRERERDLDGKPIADSSSQTYSGTENNSARPLETEEGFTDSLLPIEHY